MSNLYHDGQEKRWLARIVYRSAAGAVDVVHDIEELGEVEEIVERGPDWNTIEVIEIRRARDAEATATTLEEAENA